MAAPIGAIALAITELAKVYIIARNSYHRAAKAAGMSKEEKDKLYAAAEAEMKANDPDSFPKPWEE